MAAQPPWLDHPVAATCRTDRYLLSTSHHRRQGTRSNGTVCRPVSRRTCAWLLACIPSLCTPYARHQALVPYQNRHIYTLSTPSTSSPFCLSAVPPNTQIHLNLPRQIDNLIKPPRPGPCLVLGLCWLRKPPAALEHVHYPTNSKILSSTKHRSGLRRRNFKPFAPLTPVAADGFAVYFRLRCHTRLVTSFAGHSVACNSGAVLLAHPLRAAGMSLDSVAILTTTGKGVVSIKRQCQVFEDHLSREAKIVHRITNIGRLIHQQPWSVSPILSAPTRNLTSALW